MHKNFSSTLPLEIRPQLRVNLAHKQHANIDRLWREEKDNHEHCDFPFQLQ